LACASTVKKNGTFGFVDQFYYGPDEVIFHATCRTRAGFQAALVPSREYVFFGTPMHAEGGVVVDKESGKVIGVAPAYKRAPVYDREAIIRAAGKQNEDLARKMMPIRGRHQQEAEQRLALIGRNTDVLAGRVRADRTGGRDVPEGTIDDLYSDEREEAEAQETVAELAQASTELFN